jgi:hypothetical protein
MLNIILSPYFGGTNMNKFEQLIEFVINDEEDKAKALFHEIVVEQSKTIYEDIMSEESDAEKDDHAEKAGDEVKKDIEYDDKMDESIDESELGGSQVDNLIDEIEAEEQGVTFEDEDEIEMVDVDVEDDDDDEELEDRVVGLEDKLDELMSEFEELMGQVDDNTDDIDDVEDDHEEMDMDDETVEVDMEMEGLEENVDLTAAPKAVTTEPAGTQTHSTVAANSGAKGAVAKPVDTDTAPEKGRPAPKAQDQGNTTRPDMKAAPKPQLAQASGVNTKSVID